MSLRYIPISINSFGNTKANLSATPFNVSSEPIEIVQYPGSAPSSYVVTNFPIEYVLLFIGFALIFLIVLLYTRSWYRGGHDVYVVLGEKEQRERGIKVEYSYHGIKRILRDYFVKFRNRIRCPYCTPRETLNKLIFLKKFVEVYEDVVYGDKQRLDAENVIDEVKRFEK
ncbi:MAG: hypothetical protein QW348_06525 [Ignisphaera sp.]